MSHDRNPAPEAPTPPLDGKPPKRAPRRLMSFREFLRQQARGQNE
jgi:hypothetical protein